MGSKGRRKQQRWSTQPLTPLMEGPDPEMQDEGGKKESSWEVIREWFRLQKSGGLPGVQGSGSFSLSVYGNIPAKTQDLRLLLGVLGCPLAPIPLATDPLRRLHIKDIPIVSLLPHTHMLMINV